MNVKWNETVDHITVHDTTTLTGCAPQNDWVRFYYDDSHRDPHSIVLRRSRLFETIPLVTRINCRRSRTYQIFLFLYIFILLFIILFLYIIHMSSHIVRLIFFQFYILLFLKVVTHIPKNRFYHFFLLRLSLSYS